jgi:hypothetical protein
MKRLIAIAIVFLFILSVVPVFAQTATRKTPTPNQKAYEHASEKSAFNRAGDWFATIGKSDQEKAKIIAERDMHRAAKQAEKEAKKLQRQAEGQTKGMQQKTQQRTQQQTGKPQKAAVKGMK